MKPATISETADKKYWVKGHESERMDTWAEAVALMLKRESKRWY